MGNKRSVKSNNSHFYVIENVKKPENLVPQLASMFGLVSISLEEWMFNFSKISIFYRSEAFETKAPFRICAAKNRLKSNPLFKNLIDYPKKRYKTVADPYSGKTSQNFSKTMIITAWLTAVGISSLPVIEKQFMKDHAESNECSYSSSFPW